ncbi:alkyl sulfatase C-terminal domain-containing protein [Streptomyces sp. NPDC055144]
MTSDGGHHAERVQDASPETQLTVTGPKTALVGILLKSASAPQLAQAGKITLDGDETALQPLVGLLDDFVPDFNMITP